jgi:UPF0042 nucleotide-binding protein
MTSPPELASLNPPAEPEGRASVATKAAPSRRAGITDVVLVTGISGSGKSVALHALEDAGFFCVDNLPPELLRAFLHLDGQVAHPRVAIAIDARSAPGLPQMASLLNELRTEGISIRSVFLDASTDTLVRRFSESRRPHPLARADPIATSSPDYRERSLMDAIEIERQLLAPLREGSTVLDTSLLRPALLRKWIRELVNAQTQGLTLVFESFAFKHGVPLDADFVFDVRILPNPHYVRELRPLTGRDEPVAQYLMLQPEVEEMLNQIEAFLARWLPAFEADQRSYLTVAVGCTGGQHRSVYLVETLLKRFAPRNLCLVRHRELDTRD